MNNPIKRGFILLAVAGTVGLLASCDNGPSAVARKASGGAGPPAAAGDAGTANGDRGPGDGVAADHRRDPVRMVDGRPEWSPSRRYSGEENARRAFERNGADFGAPTLEAYVSKAHAFVDHPPKGVQTLTRRNGDRLLYDPKTNVFAVATREGAPRAMFKPDDGPAYWEEQKTREARSARSSRGADDR